MANYAIREAALTGTLSLERTNKKDLIDNIKSIQELTNAELVGSIQTDDVTGDISGIFRDPETGAMRQEIVGKSTPKNDLTYHVVDGQLVAVDPRNPTNSDGSLRLIQGYGGSDPTKAQAFLDEVDAFANQYASTGVKPTGMKDGVTFGMVAARAKELPKAPGLVVDNNTNIKSAGVGAATVQDLTDLYDISTKMKELKVLDKNRRGGVIAGTLGKLKGSEAQEAYVQLRKEIVDLLARNRTGAALTGQEVSFYNTQLPGRFAEPLSFGPESDVKIELFEKKINGSIKSFLELNNLSIHGWTTIKVGDKEYKVGDKITNPDGTEGIVLPDGKISSQSAFNSAGNASASNSGLNRPQRNKNPGNVKQGGMSDKYAIGVDDQDHLIFPSAEVGFLAMQDDVRAKISGNSRWLPKNPTLQQLASVYAEDPNWGNAVARMLKVSLNTPTQQIPLAALTQAIATQEGFYA